MSKPPPSRFRDDRTGLWSFLDEVVVACPRCRGLARIVGLPGDPVGGRHPFGPHRLVCRACGHTRDRAATRAWFPGNDRSSVTDPWFGLPLWLQVPTRHGVLWAYNLRHLAFIERFVAARLRERADFYDSKGRMTLVARLPAWLKHAGNREENLRHVARLRATVV